MAQSVSVRLLTAEALVQYQLVSVWFVVDKIALGLVILRVLRLPSQLSFHQYGAGTMRH